MFQFIALVALIATAIASPIHDNGHYEHHEHEAPTNYEFGYQVKDVHTGDIKSQHEVRVGDNVQGHYSLVEPDGHVRTVHYQDDGHSGFNAQVHRDGHVIHAQHHAALVARHQAAPVAQHHSDPVADHQAAPIAHHHSAPVAHHQAAPVAHHQAAPVAQHHSVPVAHHQAAPVAHHHAAPVAHHQAAPVAHYQTAPVAQHHSAPVAHHQAAPVAHYEADPIAKYQAAPVSHYQAAPVILQPNYFSPSFGYQTAPAASHHIAPVAHHTAYAAHYAAAPTPIRHQAVSTPQHYSAGINQAYRQIAHSNEYHQSHHH